MLLFVDVPSYISSKYIFVLEKLVFVLGSIFFSMEGSKKIMSVKGLK